MTKEMEADGSVSQGPFAFGRGGGDSWHRSRALPKPANRRLKCNLRRDWPNTGHGPPLVTLRIAGDSKLLTENPIEKLRVRSAWLRDLAVEANDVEAAHDLFQLAEETDGLIDAVIGSAPPQDEGVTSTNA